MQSTKKATDTSTATGLTTHIQVRTMRQRMAPTTPLRTIT